MKKISQALLFLLINISAYACADQLKTHKGDMFTGLLISFVDGICIFQSDYGATLKIPTSDIYGLDLQTSKEIHLTNGDRITGVIQHQGSQQLVSSSALGKIQLKMADVLRITPVVAENKEAANKAVGKSEHVQSIGGNSQDTPPLDFLTGSTVMLASGKFELELGLSYKHSRTAYPLTSSGYFQQSAYTARSLTFDLAGRLGVGDGAEIWANIPLDYTYVQQVSTNQYVRDKQAVQVGDVSFGVDYLLTKENENTPALTFNLAASAPLGKNHYYPIQDMWMDPFSNGAGHWSISTGLSFVRTTDPAILFGGVSYRHFFPRRIDGYMIRPGDEFSGYFGVGFAINERLSVGTRLSHAYQANMVADGEKIYGSDKSPMDLSIFSSYRANKNWTITPQVTFGLNDDAGKPIVSIRGKRTF